MGYNVWTSVRLLPATANPDASYIEILNLDGTRPSNFSGALRQPKRPKDQQSSVLLDDFDVASNDQTVGYYNVVLFWRKESITWYVGEKEFFKANLNQKRMDVLSNNYYYIEIEYKAQSRATSDVEDVEAWDYLKSYCDTSFHLTFLRVYQQLEPKTEA